MRILLAEDDLELARQVQAALGAVSHECFWEPHGAAVVCLALADSFDAVVVDVGLPGVDGFEVVKHLRSEGCKTPVLFLTARSEVMDRVHGLSIGGDDYLTKPFASEELLARLEALHRRSHQSAAPATKQVGRWTLDPLHRRLISGGEAITLQPLEWTLLEVLTAHEGQVLTKKFLLDKVWDIRFEPGTNVVDATICRLRRKIDPPGQPSHIETRRGKGYVFQNVP